MVVASLRMIITRPHAIETTPLMLTKFESATRKCHMYVCIIAFRYQTYTNQTYTKNLHELLA
eukprot:SAG31_NODE_10580_length_1121_cov_2.326810_2_plen_61_part_01